MEDKTPETNDDSFYEEADVTSQEYDNGEDDSTPEGDGEEDETLTLTKSELDERIKAARKEQDKRWKERIKKAGGEDESPKEARKESGEVDRIDRLELKAEGVKDRAQQDFILDYARSKKMSVTDALESRVVKAELKEMQAEAKQADATPSPSRRTAQHKSDDVSYWASQLTEKGKSAPTAEMRRKVRQYLAN